MKLLAISKPLAMNVKSSLSINSEEVFKTCNDVIRKIAEILGPDITNFFKLVLSALVRKVNNRKYAEIIMETLHIVEMNGVPRIANQGR